MSGWPMSRMTPNCCDLVDFPCTLRLDMGLSVFRLCPADGKQQFKLRGPRACEANACESKRVAAQR
eukprot:7784372-Alexandrium_andersonii.AAC.1